MRTQREAVAVLTPAERTRRRDLAWAIATDAGNRAMRKGGRVAWNDEDYAAAVRCFHAAFPEEG